MSAVRIRRGSKTEEARVRRPGFSQTRAFLVGTLTLSALAAYSVYAVPGTIVFAVIGDFGDGSTDAGEVAALVDSWSPEFVLGAGDNRYDALSFDDVVGGFYCDYLTDVTVGPNCSGGDSPANAFFPVPGNHEYIEGGGISDYTDYFTLPGAGIAGSGTSGSELYYDFVIGNVHFFGLDSQGALLSNANMDAQKLWLQAQMGASTSAFQVVYLHHPPYSSAYLRGSVPAMQWPYAAWGADAVIAGHDHTYERIDQNGIPYFVNGLGGKSIYLMGPPIEGSQVTYTADYGAMRVTADQDEMSLEFINVDNTLVDSVTTDGDAPFPRSSGNVENRILFGTDDVEENNDDGSMFVDSSDIELGSDPDENGSSQTVGLRFQYVFVPKKATIDLAYLEFTADEVHSGSTDVVIRAELSGNAPAFSSADYDVTSRLQTTASVAWSVPAWTTPGDKHQSPNLAPILQEIVDQAAWTPNSSIVFMIEGTGRRAAVAYEDSPNDAPMLRVEYSPPGC